MKRTTTNIFLIGVIVFFSAAVAGITTYSMMKSENNDRSELKSYNEMFRQNPNVKLATFDNLDAQPVDLTHAAETSVHAVVHIKSTELSKTVG